MNIINDERQLAALGFLRIVMMLSCGAHGFVEIDRIQALVLAPGSKSKMSDNPMRKAHKAPRISFMAEPHQMTEAV